jgi:hypothetical protein
MNYDKAFFEMIKLRGEELYPVSLPYAWYSVHTAAGIVLMNKEHNFEQMEWWLSWVRIPFDDAGILEATTQKYDKLKHYEKEIIATSEQLEKMSGDDIVRLLFSHFTFMDKETIPDNKQDGDEHRPKQDLQHDTETVETGTGN